MDNNSMSKEATMPQQPATLELTATINDKTFPISSLTVNIPINVTHNEINTYKVGDTYTTLITPKPTKHRRTHHTIHKRNQSIQKQHSKPTPTR